MTDGIRFTVPGRLKGKGRPRFSKKSGTVYTPAQTANAEASLKAIAYEAMKGRPLFEGPLCMDIEIRINTPASWSKKRKAEAIHVTGKPDADNIIKLIGDSCNGVIWKDDSQIASLNFRRFYCDSEGESARIMIYRPQTGLAKRESA